jgi:hypothetical protein
MTRPRAAEDRPAYRTGFCHDGNHHLCAGVYSGATCTCHCHHDRVTGDRKDGAR